MSTMHLDDDSEALGNLDSKATPPKIVVVDDSVEATDAQLVKAWVRHKLGTNRGEKRSVHGTVASFDALLDQRFAANPVDLDTLLARRAAAAA